MTLQHIGQDFTKSIKLNLMPHIGVQKAYYAVSINYIENNSYTSTSYQSYDDNVSVIVGKDVYELDYQIMYHTSALSANICRTSIRVDRLILLNIAAKLLKKI